MRIVSALAVAAPVFAVMIAPLANAQQAPERLLPTTAAAYADYQGEVGAMNKSQPLKSSDELDKALNTFGAQNAAAETNDRPDPARHPDATAQATSSPSVH